MKTKFLFIVLFTLSFHIFFAQESIEDQEIELMVKQERIAMKQQKQLVKAEKIKAKEAKALEKEHKKIENAQNKIKKKQELIAEREQKIEDTKKKINEEENKLQKETHKYSTKKAEGALTMEAITKWEIRLNKQKTKIDLLKDKLQIQQTKV